jgi:hypothetical protein
MFFYFSSSDVIGEDQLSEFWNRDDNASGSDEDISDSDGKSLSFLGRVGGGGGGDGGVVGLSFYYPTD